MCKIEFYLEFWSSEVILRLVYNEHVKNTGRVISQIRVGPLRNGREQVSSDRVYELCDVISGQKGARRPDDSGFHLSISKLYQSFRTARLYRPRSRNSRVLYSYRYKIILKYKILFKPSNKKK